MVSESNSIPSPSPSVEIPEDNEKEKDYNILWFFKEYPNKDMLEVCEQYLGKLGELVEECIKRFSGSPDDNGPDDSGSSGSGN